MDGVFVRHGELVQQIKDTKLKSDANLELHGAELDTARGQLKVVGENGARLEHKTSHLKEQVQNQEEEADAENLETR